MVFKRGAAVFRRIKKGSGVVLKLFFPRRGAGPRVPVAPMQDSPVTHQPVEVALAVPQPARNRLDRPLAARLVVPPRVPPVTLAPLGIYGVCKRAGDVTCALVLLVLTAPLLLVAMLLVKLTSRGPALYTQTRVARGGRPFTIYKLRTMIHKCESLTGARWSVPGDPRVTPVGRFLRRTHLDELPQLWNVLRGDMSLVGPRPERPEFVPQLEQAIPSYRERLAVRPGVTGLAQVQLPPDTDLESVRVKLAYDLYYARNIGFWLDLRLALATACKMIGLPFRVLRRLFRLPARDTIENAYRGFGCNGRAPCACAHTA
jgi:lipopolysaccharide/colanic/teichoic acid biosynthesis glycosyltransferase